MYLGEVFRDGKTGNLNYLHLLKDKLKTLKINNCFIEDGIIPQSVIDSILLCEKIDHLYIDTNRFTMPPTFVNQMDQLRLLYIGGGVDWNNTFNNWGDLSNLTNLQSLYCPVASNAPTDIPPYIKDFPNLVRFYVNGSYDTQERWDEFIENLYNYTVLFAPIANDDVNNPVGARNYKVLNNRFSATYVVTGEYEQPFGYEQGVSNGEANTQLQKIWVLKNQYNVNVLYKDNRALDGGN